MQQGRVFIQRQNRNHTKVNQPIIEQRRTRINQRVLTIFDCDGLRGQSGDFRAAATAPAFEPLAA